MLDAQLEERYGYGMESWDHQTFNLAEGRGFRTTYGVGDGQRASVEARVGLGSNEALADIDYQTIKVDDPRLPVLLGGEFTSGLTLVHLHISNRPSGPGVTQTDLRRSGMVALLRDWAKVARRFQLGESFDDDLEGLVDLPGEEDLFTAIRESTRRVSAALNSPTDPASPRRRRGRDEAEAALHAVVARYRELTDREHPDRSPRQTLAAEFGYHEAHIGRLLVKARRRVPPLLGPAAPGKAGELKEEK